MRKAVFMLVIFAASLACKAHAVNLSLFLDVYHHEWEEAKEEIEEILAFGCIDERVEALVAGAYIAYMRGRDREVSMYLHALDDEIHQLEYFRTSEVEWPYTKWSEESQDKCPLRAAE